MNTEERQLAEMLRRVTPEPPRGLTVEDVAFRVASQGGPGRGGHREPRLQPGFPSRRWTRKWAPVLAASSVFVLISVSAGAVVGLTSHHTSGPAPGRQRASGPASPSASSASPAQTSTGPPFAPEPVANGIWGAELISRQTFAQGSLAAGADSLYAIAPGYLDRINPATGQVVNQAPYHAPTSSPPVVTGHTVWVVSSYAVRDVVLLGYDSTTLAQVGSVAVQVSGPVSATPEGIVTSGSDGYLYVAAGRSVAVVNPATRHVIRQVSVSSGPVNSVAVSPDGGSLYVGTGSFELQTYNLATGTQTGSSALPGIDSSGGNLVATAGGVWGTAGVGMSEWAWFAPEANLTQFARVTQGTGAGPDSVPAFSGGAVWIGGSQTLECANPDTGRQLASVAIPTDGGVLEQFGHIVVAGGRAYAQYADQRARQSGVAVLTPPSACSG